MDNEKIKAYEHSIGEYLHTTIYNPDSLTEYLPKDKWFLMNPSRGARNGFVDYDMSINKDNLISEILKGAYGEIEACRYIVDNYTYRFNRRAVACGGALYPNNVYVFTQKQKSINIYQFIPALNILRLIKRIETGIEAGEKVYFVYTNYYWRNWPKYKYFGYRLMQVDTGYAMANLSLLLSSMNIDHDVIISSNINKEMSDILELNLQYEAVEGIIEGDADVLLPAIEKLNSTPEPYKLFDDWDTQPVSLYEVLERKVLKEDFNLSQSVKDLSNIEGLNKSNRISPGGGLMISRTKIEGELFGDVVNELKAFQNIFDVMSDGVEVYMYVNNVVGLEKGTYRLEDNGFTFIEPVNPEKELSIDMMLRKKNFNLFEVPILFFVGGKRDSILKNDSVNDFKLMNIKAGFTSQLITRVMCNHDLWTHPILGYDVYEAEKLFGFEDVCFLNLIPVSNVKPLDRESVEY